MHLENIFCGEDLSELKERPKRWFLEYFIDLNTNLSKLNNMEKDYYDLIEKKFNQIRNY